MKRIFILLKVAVICVVNVFGQTGIMEKYAPIFAKFDSLNNLHDKNAADILIEIEKTKDLKFNDTLQINLNYSWEKYYIINYDLEKVRKYCTTCEQIAIKNKKQELSTNCFSSLGMAYFKIGEYDSAVLVFKKALKLAQIGTNDYYKVLMGLANSLSSNGNFKESNTLLLNNIDLITNKGTKAVAYATIASNYESLDSKMELDNYYLKAIENLKGEEYSDIIGGNMYRYASYLKKRKAYKKLILYADSIVYYSKNNEEAYAMESSLKAIAYLGLKNYSKALFYAHKALNFDLKSGNPLYISEDYETLGKINLALGKSKEAENYFKKSLETYDDDPLRKMRIIENYISVFLKNNKLSVYKKFEEYVSLRDSIYDSENFDKLAEFDTKYKTAEKEIKIQQQQLQLSAEKNRRNLAFTGILFLLSVVGVGFYYFKNREKRNALLSQNNLLELQLNLNKMEMQNLNQQLNPHEIKNLLFGIAPEIITKAPEAYNQMTNLFNIIKSSLNNEITDTIENQLQQVEAFLQLTKNNISVPFSYQINNSIIQTDSKQLPRLMLKNMVENAVKHGIKNNPKGGNIQVELSLKSDFYHITIADNGIANTIFPSTGIGLSTYQRLFAILNKKNKHQASLQISSNEQGTFVHIQVPTQYDYT